MKLMWGGAALGPVFLAFSAVFWAALVPTSAKAQTFVCGNGPGPGERQVGTTGGGNSGLAPMPVCVRDGPVQPAPPRVQMRVIDNYFAAAWHADSRDAWITSGYGNEGRAVQAALSACNKAMGGGCTLATSWVNGTVAIARGSLGKLYSATDAKKGDAERKVKQYCLKQNDECVVINWLTANRGSAPVGTPIAENPELHAPQGNPRLVYGALAWIDAKQRGQTPWTGDVWVVGGRSSAAKAQADVLAMCQTDMKIPCIAAYAAPQVFVSVADRGGRSVSASTGPTADLAERRALEQCKAEKVKCRVAATIDFTQDLTMRFDPFAQGKPYFSAQAWTKDAKQPWAMTVWSVSGAKSAEDAKRAALSACKKDSKQECGSSSAFNGFVAITIDSTGNPRTVSFERDQEPVSIIAKKCAELKLTCRLVKMVDARVPLTERIAVK